MSVSVRLLAAMLFSATAFACFADVGTQSSTAIQNSALRQYQRALVDPAYPVVEQMQQNRTDFERMVKKEQQNAAPTSEKLARFGQWLSMLQADIQGQRSARVAVRNQFLAGTDPRDIHTNLASFDCADAVMLGEGSFAANLSANQTVWVALQSDAKQTLQINTIGSNVDTKIASYGMHCPTANQAPEELRDDDLGLAARYELPPARGVRKFLAISADQAGDVQIRVSLANASIRGKVTTPFVNGNNSTVTAGRYENGYFSFIGNANTQSDGTYSISVPANSYYVFAYSNYFSQLLPQLYPAAPCFGQVGGSYCAISNATLMQLADSAVINGIDFNLSEGAIVSGRVTGQRPGDTPFVTAYFPENTNITVQANVDSAGRFRVSGLPAANVKIYAGAYGAQSQIYDGINCPQSGCNLNLGLSIPIMLGVDRTNINFNLKKLPTISGRILGPPNSSNAVAYDTNGTFFFANTDSFGNYTLTLQPGSYYLSFNSTGFSSKLYDNKPCLGPNQSGICTNYASGTVIILTEQQNLIINTTLGPLGSISGKVLDDLGVSIVGATVGVCSAADSISCGPNYFSAQAQTNQTGDYSISGLQAGGYFVIAASRLHLDKAYPDVDCQFKPGVSCSPQFSGAVLIAVEDNVSSTGINFSLKRASSISGVLGERPFFYYAGVEAARTGFTTGIYSELVTLTNNSYKLIDLPAGEYRLIAGRQNSAIFPQIFAYRNCTGTLASPCQINSGDPVILDQFANVTGKDFNFARRSGASGYVRNINGAPISNAIVDYWAIQQAPLLPQRTYSTLTDSQGRFSLGSNSSSGNFYLSTDAPNDVSNRIYASVQCAVGTSAYAGTCSFAGATVLSAPAEIPGQLDNIIFNLPPSGLNQTFLADGFESRIE